MGVEVAGSTATAAPPVAGAAAPARPSVAGRALALLGVLPAVVLAGWLAAVYPLAALGAAQPVPALLVGVPVVVLLGRLVVRRTPAVPNTPWWSVLATVGILAGYAVLSASRHAEHVILRRDGAVYALAARGLAGTGRIAVPIDLRVVGGGSGYGSLFGSASPGYYPSGDTVVPQFMSGTAVALAPGAWFSRWGALFTLPAVYTALAVLALAGLVARLVGPRWAPLAAAALVATQPMQVVARSTYSEPLALLLLAGGLCLLVDALAAAPVARTTGRRERLGGAAAVAAVAGLVLGIDTLVRVDAVREVALVVPLVGWMAVRRRPEWLPFALGLLLGAGYGAVDAIGLSWPYVSDLLPYLGPVLVGCPVLAVLVAAGAAVGRRVLPAPRVRGALPAVRTSVAAVGASAAVVTLGYLAVRPYLQTGSALPNPLLPALQQEQGLPVDATRTYQEQALRWVSWYVGWPALALAGIGAVLLTWRALRGPDHRWPVAFPLVASAVLVVWQPRITPDHPWADRRLVPSVLPAVVLLAVWTLAMASRRAPDLVDSVLAALSRRRARGWPVVPAGRAGPAGTPPRTRRRIRRVAVPTAVVAGLGGCLLVTPAEAVSRPLAKVRTEVGEPAAVAAACGGFAPGDVALLIDDRSRQEWLPVLRQVCDLPAFAVPAQADGGTATATQVAPVVTRVRSAGGRPVLVAQSGQPLPLLTGEPQRRLVRLDTVEYQRLLTRPARGGRRLQIELWIALPS